MPFTLGQFPLRLKEGQGAENKKRALLIFLRALLNLKVYGTFNMQTNIIKRGSSLFFLLKGKKGVTFLMIRNKGAIHSMKGQAGRSALMKLSGKNSAYSSETKHYNIDHISKKYK